MFALFFINRQMTATPKRKMSVHNVATGTWGDTAWAAFAYTIDDGINKRTGMRSEEHTSELQSLTNLVCRLLLEKKQTDCKNAGIYPQRLF